MGRTNLRSVVGMLFIIFLSARPALAAHSSGYSKRRASLRRHRVWLRWNPLLRGSRDSLLRQNAEIDRLELPRIHDDEELSRLTEAAELVPIADRRELLVSARVKPGRRYCRRWTLEFLEDLSRDYYQEFHQPIVVTSAVRTAQQQRKLRRRIRNAAPEYGEIASSHLAGITVDIAKRGMTRKQHKWIENYLVKLRDQQLVEAAEERRTACFHIMVSDRYSTWREERRLAQDHQPSRVPSEQPQP